MKHESFNREPSATLLPEQLSVSEYFNVSSRQNRLAISTEQDYQVDDGLRSKLEPTGLILARTGIEHPSGSLEFVIPTGVVSLSAFLNSTSTDQRKLAKRRLVFDGIEQSLRQLADTSIGLHVEPAATRHNLGLNDDGQMVLLPVNLEIAEMDQKRALRQNVKFFLGVQRDILESSPADDREFPF